MKIKQVYYLHLGLSNLLQGQPVPGDKNSPTVYRQFNFDRDTRLVITRLWRKTRALAIQVEEEQKALIEKAQKQIDGLDKEKDLAAIQDITATTNESIQERMSEYAGSLFEDIPKISIDKLLGSGDTPNNIDANTLALLETILE